MRKVAFFSLALVAIAGCSVSYSPGGNDVAVPSTLGTTSDGVTFRTFDVPVRMQIAFDGTSAERVLIVFSADAEGDRWSGSMRVTRAEVLSGHLRVSVDSRKPSDALGSARVERGRDAPTSGAIDVTFAHGRMTGLVDTTDSTRGSLDAKLFIECHPDGATLDDALASDFCRPFAALR